MVVLAGFQPMHLEDVLDLCRQQRWPTFPSNPDRALHALLAPGTVTVVAVAHGELIGFAHAMTATGTTYLAQLLVSPAHRGQGIGCALISDVFRRCGAERFDVLTNTAEGFYAGIPHRRYRGFRLCLGW